jgi:putative transposase
MLRPDPYLSKKLTRPLPTKDGGVLRTVKDARTYMMALSKHREASAQWQIATKLAHANDLAMRGKRESEIARMLGVSIMTLHRWRKASHRVQPAQEVGQPNGAVGRGSRIAEFELENSRLRQLVTDLLLEKIKLEEAAQRQKFLA